MAGDLSIAANTAAAAAVAAAAAAGAAGSSLSPTAPASSLPRSPDASFSLTAPSSLAAAPASTSDEAPRPRRSTPQRALAPWETPAAARIRNATDGQQQQQ